MGKRKRKKARSLLTWRAVSGSFRMVFQGLVKSTPLVLLVLLGSAIFWGIRQELYADPGFTVKNVEFFPQGALTPERVQELERNFVGQNLFKVSLQDVARQLERDPRIRQARVSRRFPKVLRIDIAHRQAFAQIKLNPSGPFYTVGEDGFVLGPAGPRQEVLLLVDAVGLGLAKPSVGSKPALPGFTDGVDLVRAFWEHPFSQSELLHSLRLSRLGEATLVLEHGPELRFGRHPLKKFNSFEAALPLLRGPERGRLVYIEFQYQDLIVRKREAE